MDHSHNPGEVKRDLVAETADALRRIIVHYGLWLSECVHQFGLDKALEIERLAGDKSFAIQIKRLSEVLGFELKNGLPTALFDLDPEKLAELARALGVNWLANDGVWFQAVEQAFGMDDAKRTNDTCWSRFSPYEAARIKALLDMPEHGGLDALKTALGHRLYARINKQRIAEEDERSFVFRMCECRVQAARKRKGLPDYPCKSGGLVEYRSFARAVDPRIRVECLACPPDEHPEAWYCAWRFSVED